MGRQRIDDEADEYYDDDPQERALLDPEEERASLRQRVVAVFGTSYGVSVALHVGVLLLLATIVITAPPERAEARIEIKKHPTPPTPPEVEKSLRPTPEIPVPEVVTDPVVDLVDEPTPVDIPAGDPQDATEKELEDISISDAYGIGGTPAGMRGRHGRMRAVGETGGSRQTVESVDAALRWLARHQSPDGRWAVVGWERNCARGRCDGPGTNAGHEGYDVGVTSLALLAFMGQGHSHRFGDFKQTVNRGLTWLRAQERPDGGFGFKDGETIYNHALATMALCEAYGVSRDFTLRRPAERAVRFCLDAQNPGLGWKYGVRPGRNDTSVTGWMVLALKAAVTAGIEVPDAAFAGAQAWFERATDAYGEVGYETPGGGSSFLAATDGAFEALPTMTAVALVGRIFTGDRPEGDAIRRGARALAKNLPTWEPRRANFYYWYYGTYALFQVDGPSWKAWNGAMQAALVPNQRTGGCADGSWDGVGEWCLAGGRVYATAINALTLQIYYRYARKGEAEVALGAAEGGPR